jgi:glutathionylspermidine amidase/synthetase
MGDSTQEDEELKKQPEAPFGSVLGISCGDVAVYSSDYSTADPTFFSDRNSYRHFEDGVFTGIKWQCVELARRWLLKNKGYVFDDIAMAYDAFSLKSFRRISDSVLLPAKSFLNGSQRWPEAGSILVWKEGGHFDVTGHVAIVVEVSALYVRVVEQNVFNDVWPQGQAFSRQLQAHIDPYGGFWVHDLDFDKNTVIWGWVIQTDSDAHATELEPIKPKLLELKRFENRVEQDMSKIEFLDDSHPAEKAFLSTEGSQHYTPGSSTIVYYGISESALKQIVRATNELHEMFLRATNIVIQDPILLSKFNIPEILWPRLRKSWENRNKHTIHGRFDFAVSKRGVKTYEYNADSASCLMECGLTLGRWCEAIGITEGFDPGRDVFERLVENWKRISPGGYLHILKDNDAEENYHALYMKSAIEAAGIRCKVLTGMSGLSWSPDCLILDQDGEEVKVIWKTWAWETALEQLRKELAADEEKGSAVLMGCSVNDSPRLMDVLFHPKIKVFEPFWTIVTSNKTILTILSSIMPLNQFLLSTGFEVTPEMLKHGYVSKPIDGRRGKNVTLHAPDGAVVEKTEGKFGTYGVVYQELHVLPKFGDEVIQVNSFAVGGKYAGTVLRTDKKLIIDSDSPIVPLRVLPDSEWDNDEDVAHDQ